MRAPRFRVVQPLTCATDATLDGGKAASLTAALCGAGSYASGASCFAWCVMVQSAIFEEQHALALLPMPTATAQPPPPPPRTFLCSPQGKTCVGNAASANVDPVDCTADNANPYLGQTAGACLSCAHTTSRYTSYAAAAYCTIPFFDRKCNEAPYTAGGYEWDENAAACVQCRPGTYRSQTMLADGANFKADCQEW